MCRIARVLPSVPRVSDSDCGTPDGGALDLSSGSMHNAPDVTPSHQIGGYHEFAPPPDLGDAVEALWIHQAADVNVVSHRVVPDAAVSLCFMGRRAPDGSAGDARLRIIGPVIRPHAFAPPPGHRMESVRIKLEWCRALLDVAPWEQVDAEPLHADVRPALAAPLRSHSAIPRAAALCRRRAASRMGSARVSPWVRRPAAPDSRGAGSGWRDTSASPQRAARGIVASDNSSHRFRLHEEDRISLVRSLDRSARISREIGA